MVGITSLFYLDMDRKEEMRTMTKRMDEDKKEANDDRTETKVIAFVAAVAAVAATLR